MARHGQPQNFKANNRKPKETRGRPRDPSLKKLSMKQQAVVDWYFHPEVNFVKKEALLRAGYASTTAKSNPMSVFTLPSVARAIEERLADHKLRFNVDRDWITQRRMILANANITGIVAKLEKDAQERGLHEWDLSILTWEEQYALREMKTRTYKEGRGANAETVVERTVKGESPHPHLEGLARLHGLNQDSLKVTGGLTVVELLQNARKRMKKPNA